MERGVGLPGEGTGVVIVIGRARARKDGTGVAAESEGAMIDARAGKIGGAGAIVIVTRAWNAGTGMTLRESGIVGDPARGGRRMR